ncbi:MAG: Hsp20/alpha crystallin family protein [Candidatus Woesearchaeota archaeon]
MLWKNPFNEMRKMQREMDRLFESFFDYEPLDYDRPLLEDATQRGLTKTNYRQPLADIYDDENELKANIELPGINKDDIKITAHDNGVSISVEKKDEQKTEDKKKGIYRIERRYSGYRRFIPIAGNFDKKNIDAKYKDGILELKVPKLEPKISDENRIEVK